MKYSLVRTVAPTIEPITLQAAKDHLRVETEADDQLIGIYLRAAREHCEKVTGRAILQQTWMLSLERFPSWLEKAYEGRSPCLVPNWASGSEILLPKPKLMAVTGIKFTDTSGAEQTLDPTKYRTTATDDVAKLFPAYGQLWPVALPTPGAVQITYTAGYGDSPDQVPAVIALAMLLLVGHWYENREATQAALTGNGPMPLPIGVDSLLADETIVAFTYES